MHAAAHGLIWLACGLAERGPALLVVDDVHWADAPSLRWLVQLARQLADLRARHPVRGPLRRAARRRRTCSPSCSRPRRSRRCGRAPLGPAAAESLVRERLPGADPAFAHSCHAATAGNPFLLGALLAHLVAERVEPTGDVAARLSSFGPEQVARSVERQLSRLPDRRRARSPARSPCSAAARRCGTPPDSPASTRRPPRGWPTGCAPPGCSTATATGRARAPAGRRRALREPAARRALALARRRGAAARRERADPEAVALHLLHTEPAPTPATVAALRAAADRAERARRAGERGRVPAPGARRAAARPRRAEADVRAELGLALAAQVSPTRPRCSPRPSSWPRPPASARGSRLRGARALGLAGHFDDAVDLAGAASTEPAGTPPEVARPAGGRAGRQRWLPAPARSPRPASACAGRPGRRRCGSGALNAALQAMCDGSPPADVRARSVPAFDDGAPDAEPDSMLRHLAKFSLIAYDELGRAPREPATR